MSGLIAGVILAGGASRRMGGGDKGLLPLQGRAMLQRVIDALTPQCDGLLISANGDLRRFAQFGLPVIGDARPVPIGPLGGILRALDWLAAHRPDVTHALTAPSDTPFLPPDLRRRLVAASQTNGADFACATSQGRQHAIIALWPVAAREDLVAAAESGRHSLHAALDGKRLACVDWAGTPRDPFFNVNAPGDLERARNYLTGAVHRAPGQR